MDGFKDRDDSFSDFSEISDGVDGLNNAGEANGPGERAAKLLEQNRKASYFFTEYHRGEERKKLIDAAAPQPQKESSKLKLSELLGNNSYNRRS